jgi:hypothetical protein
VSDNSGACVLVVMFLVTCMALGLAISTCTDRETERDRLCAHIFRVEAQTASDTISLVNDYPCAMPRRKP